MREMSLKSVTLCYVEILFSKTLFGEFSVHAIGCFKQSHWLFYIKPLAVGCATDAVVGVIEAVGVIWVVRVVVSLAV